MADENKAKVQIKSTQFNPTLRIFLIVFGVIVGGFVMLVAIATITVVTEGPKKAGVAKPPVDKSSVERKATEFSAGRGTPCWQDGKVTQIDFAVGIEGTLLTRPEKGAVPTKIIVGNEALPAPLETTASVREICRVGDWSEVRVVSHTDSVLQGWVPSSILRKVLTYSDGRRVYEARDFTWPAGVGSAKAAVVTLANRIMDQRSDCLAIDAKNLVLAGPASTGTFSVPCFVEGDLASFDFRVADAISGSNFRPVEPLTEDQAILACQHYAQSKASHPSTVEFGWGNKFKGGSDGRTEVSTTFKAKNSFNLELEFDVTCNFTGDQLDDIRVMER
jgi:hypothetical protein